MQPDQVVEHHIDAAPVDTTTDPMLDVALSYIARSWPVFPCRAADDFDRETGEVLMEKAPLIPNGFRGATLNERVVRELWKRNPGALVGIPTGERSGFWVLDIDVPPKHEDGRPWLASMEEAHGALETRAAETGSGGLHFLFKHAHGIRNADVASGVETRGEGGYFIAPGSVMEDGRAYKWLNDKPIVEAPQWLLDLLLKPRPASTYVAATVNYESTDAAEIDDLLSYVSPDCGYQDWVNVLMAVHSALGAEGLSIADAWSSRGKKYKQGEVARKWKGFASSGGVGLGSLCELARHGGADLSAISRKHRPLPSDDTPIVSLGKLVKAEMAVKDAAKPKLEAASLPKAENVKPELTKSAKDKPANHDEESAQESEISTQTSDTAAATDTPTDQPIFVATPYTFKDPRKLPKREFAFGTHYIRKYVSVTVSPGGIGKTSNSIVEAASMVSGKDLTGIKPPSRLRCWLFNAEDPRDEMERRIQAVCLHYKLKPDDINGHLFLDTGREQDLVVAVDDKRSGTKVQVPIVKAVIEQILRNKIDVMIVDPFVSTHQVNENDNGAIDKVAKLWAQIADDTNCSIDIVHHLRKQQDGREATVEDARGAVSLIGAARSVRVLNRMSEEQATAAGVPTQDRYSYFNIHQGKANLTKMSMAQDWRKMESVPLGNQGKSAFGAQDFAGVVTEWHWPGSEDIKDGLTGEQLQHIKTLLDNGDYKPAANAKNWAGQAVAYAIGLDVDDSAQKRRAGTILKALIKEGEIAEVFGRDPVSRKAAAFVRSNEYNQSAT